MTWQCKCFGSILFLVKILVAFVLMVMVMYYIKNKARIKLDHNISAES